MPLSLALSQAESGPQVGEVFTEYELLLAAMAEGAVGWLSPRYLAERTGLDPSRVADLLAVMSTQGWLDVTSPAVEVCLSTLGAHRLGLVVVEDPTGTPVWDTSHSRIATRSTSRPSMDPLPESYPVGEPGDDDETWQEHWSLADPTPGPLEQLVAFESQLHEYTRPPSDPYAHLRPPGPPPYPRMILGIRERWDTHEPIAPERCPACHGRRLAWDEYCAICDSWGPTQLPGRGRG